MSTTEIREEIKRVNEEACKKLAKDTKSIQETLTNGSDIMINYRTLFKDDAVGQKLKDLNTKTSKMMDNNKLSRGMLAKNAYDASQELAVLQKKVFEFLENTEKLKGVCETIETTAETAETAETKTLTALKESSNKMAGVIDTLCEQDIGLHVCTKKGQEQYNK